MKMQILTIVIYHKDGVQTRKINFNLGKVNIITGNSNTGKSTLIEIVEYCLGNRDFKIPMTRSVADNVACYGVLYQMEDRQLFVAKKVPEPVGRKSNSKLYFVEGDTLNIPHLESIQENSTDDELKVYLGRLIGIPDNEIDPGPGSHVYDANIRHTIYYLFQKNNDVIDDNYLFYKQGKDQNDRTIKDTLPVLLKAVNPDYVQIKQQLRQRKREASILRREIKEAEEIRIRGVSLLPGLLLQAQQLGLLDSSVDPEEADNGRELLADLLQNERTSTAVVKGIEADDQIQSLRRQLEDLRQQYTVQRARIEQYEDYEQGTNGYEQSALEHEGRLETIDYFNEIGTSSNSPEYCPLCGSEVEHPDPDIEDLQKSLADIRAQLQTAEVKKPVLTEVIDTLQKRLLQIVQEIRQVESNIETLLQQQRSTVQAIPSEQITSYLGGVEMFLRLAPQQQDELLEKQQTLADLEEMIESLTDTLEEAEGADRLDISLQEISSYMTEYGKQIGDEYRGSVFSFKLNRLSVLIALPGDIREFGVNVGSDKNQLQIHLALYLALHRYFISYGCPVPGFIIFDQVDKPFYPDDTNYAEVSNPEELMNDPDRQALLEVFSLFYQVCEELNGNLQIIVLQHANFPDDAYQTSVIENWRDGDALIPADWHNPNIEEN